MNLGKLLATVGETALSVMVPGSGPLIEMVNGFLPDGSKLSSTATGHQAISAINSLPAEQQEKVMAKELDVEIAKINSFANIQQSLATADASGNSTRPQIALMMARVVCFSVLALITIWCVTMLQNDTSALKTLAGSTPFVATVLGTPTTLLFTYFGKRTKEKLGRYSMATGQQPPGILSTFAKILGRKA